MSDFPVETTIENNPSKRLSVDEAYNLFASTGVPRSPRTIRRYCARGDLDCMLVDTEQNQKYLVERLSAERLIKQLQQIVAMTGARTSPDESGVVRTGPDASGHDRPNPDMTRKREAELLADIKDMEGKVRGLEIDKAVRQQIIDRLDEERTKLFGDLKSYVGTLIEQSRTIGKLEAENRLLRSGSLSTADDSGVTRPENLDSAATDAEFAPDALGGDNAFGQVGGLKI